MASKRTRKEKDEIPSKKRHIESNNENVDTTNAALLAEPPSQIVLDSIRKAGLKSGKIKKIHLRNFMCHGNFEVNLNSSINVFVGLNGSGKSAILTALAIGLGSKASSTSRSTSLKDLVKQGEVSATIEITLTNDGLDSYEEDVYGSEITVVRTINANTGSSIYKLKSDKGKVIRTGRQDLNKLTLCLNIQVENPVLILNQDAARSFLRECDPKKLYTLFLKATQIETIIEKLHDCLKCSISSKAQLEHLNRSITSNEEEIITVKERQEKLESVVRLRKEISELTNELCWLKVIDAEKISNEFQEKLTKTQIEIAQINDFVNNKSKYEKQLKEKIRDLGTEFTNLNETHKQKTITADEARTAYESHKDGLSASENAHRINVEKLKAFDTNISQLQADINAAESNPLNVGNMRKENEAKIEAIEKKQADLALILQNAQRDHGQFDDTLNDSRENHERAKTTMIKTHESINGCDIQIRQLQGAKQNALSAYGPSMSQLINRIEDLHKKKRFAEMPRGPLGRYIEVPDKKYKTVVENILDRTLVSFFVSCDKDRILLTQLLKEFPDLSGTPIITGKFHNKVYDVSEGIVDLDGRAGQVLMNVIKVADPVVMNCLIDQKRIEAIVLVERINDAIELTQNVEDVPQNLLRVVMMKPLSEYYPAPNYRTYAMREKPARYIQTNNKELIAAIDHQKQTFEAKLRQIQEFMKKNEAEIREKTNLVKEKRQLIAELRNKEREYQQNIDELKAVDYPAEDENDFLRQELEVLMKRREPMVRRTAEAKQKLEHDRALSTKMEAKATECREAARQARDNMAKIQLDIENTQQQLREMGNELKLKQNQLIDLKLLETGTAQQLQQAQEAVEVLIAQSGFPRVVPKHTEEGATLKIKTYESRIQKIEESNDNMEDIQLLLENKTGQLDRLQQIRVVLQQVLTKLEAIRESRFFYIRRLRQHMSIRCRHKFNVVMGLRDYAAEIEIDHKEKTLELKVVPRDARIANAVATTKALSGGERSYSTVALLISLWSCVDHPFYALDEYDVFSDEHNRHMMTMLLFHEAEKKREKQYCFLTPQDFSNIHASATTTIHKLHDPERRQHSSHV